MSLCIYCRRNFTNKYTLTRHLKQSKCDAFSEMSQYEVYLATLSSLTLDDLKDSSASGPAVSAPGSPAVSHSRQDMVNVSISTVDTKRYARMFIPKTTQLIYNYDTKTGYSKLYEYIYSFVKNILVSMDHDVRPCYIRWERVSPPSFVVYTEDECPIRVNTTGAVKYIYPKIKEGVHRAFRICYAQMCKTQDFDKDLYEIDHILRHVNDKLVKEIVTNVIVHCVLRDPVFKMPVFPSLSSKLNG